MTSAFPQFELANMFRCPATDGEGYRCRREPQHDGPHHWDRCEYRDAGGHHCGLPPHHPGGHFPPWYDLPAQPGQTHAIKFSGTERYAGGLADRVTAIVAGYGWVLRSRTFEPGPAWRATLSRLFGSGQRSGRVTVVFEFAGSRDRASDQPAPDREATADPAAGNRRST
jgi:hypothetical protein